MIKKISFWGTILTCLFLTTNCGQFKAQKSKRDQVLSSLLTANPNKTLAVVSRRQLFPNFKACLGLSSPSAQTKKVFSDVASSLSAEGAAQDISAPLLTAVTKIASEFCNDLVNQEASGTKKFFTNFTLGTTGSFNLSSANDTVNKLANACWGRPATDEEVNLIKNSIGKTKLLQAPDKNAALYICTAVLSSSASIKF